MPLKKKVHVLSTGFQNFSVRGKIRGRGAVKGCPRGVRAVPHGEDLILRSPLCYRDGKKKQPKVN